MKRIVSLIISIVLVISLVPGLVAFATEETDSNLNNENIVYVQNKYYGSSSSDEHQNELARAMLAKLPYGENYVGAYDAMLNSIQNGENFTLLGKFDLPIGSSTMILNAIMADHAEYFWIKLGVEFEYNDEVDHISYQTYFKGDELEAAKQAFNAEVEKVLSNVNPYMTAYEKELYIHDYLIHNTEYVYLETGEHGQTAYSALVQHQSVCGGYSKAFQALMSLAGVPCMFVTGTGSSNAGVGGHGWNLVKLDNTYTWVDPTWDDQTSEVYQYKYFNATDSTMEVGHTLKSSTDSEYLFYQYIPSCTSTAYTRDNMNSSNVVDVSKTISASTVAKAVNSPTKSGSSIVAKVPYKNGNASTLTTWFSNNFSSVMSTAGQSCNSSFTSSTDSLYAYFTLSSPSGKGTIYGSLYSNYNSSSPVTLTVKNSGGSTVFTKTYTGANTSYVVFGLAPGTYTLTFSKSLNVTRTYTVTVSSGAITTQNVTLSLIGDIDGNSWINSKDADKLVNHLVGTSTLSGYALSLADINADGVVNNRDASFMLRNILGNESITGVKKTYSTSSSTPTIKPEISEFKAYAGENISIPIVISNNSGIMGFKMSLSYNSSQITPASECIVKNDEIFNVVGDNFITKVSASSANVLYSGVQNVSNTGTLFNFNFHISDDLNSSTKYVDITISFDSNGTFDQTYDSVNVVTENIRIYIAPCPPSGLVGVAPSTTDASDGKITGTTTAMEWNTSATSDTGWTTCTASETSNLAAGTYYVRYKETNDAISSNPTKIIVGGHVHVFDCQVVSDKYLRSEATHTNRATYLYSCACGEPGHTFFSYGEPLDHKYGEWKYYNSNQHKRVCEYNSSHYEIEDHTWDDGVITREPLCKQNGTITYTCTGCGTKRTASVPELGHTYDSKTKVCHCGSIDPSYTGIALTNYGSYCYVISGKEQYSTDNIVTIGNDSHYYAGKKVYISSSRVQTSYTGLIGSNDGTYWYVIKGVAQTSKTGVYKMNSSSYYYAGEYVYIKNGKLQDKYIGLAKKSDGTYWYIIEGNVESITGFVEIPSTSTYKAGKTLYISKGKFLDSYTGLKKDYSEIYRYVSKGVASTKTGFVKMTSDSTYYKDKTVYLEKGYMQKGYTGLIKVKSNDTTSYYYVSKGVKSTKTGLVSLPYDSKYQSNKMVLLKSGKLDTTYTGLVKVTSGSKTNYYYVYKGIKSTKTDLVKMPSTSSYQKSKTIYIENGQFMNTYTGLVPSNDKLKYVVKGIFTAKTGKVKMPAGSNCFPNTTVVLKKGIFLYY